MVTVMFNTFITWSIIYCTVHAHKCPMWMENVLEGKRNRIKTMKTIKTTATAAIAITITNCRAMTFIKSRLYLSFAPSPHRIVPFNFRLFQISNFNISTCGKINNCRKQTTVWVHILRTFGTDKSQNFLKIPFAPDSVYIHTFIHSLTDTGSYIVILMRDSLDADAKCNI